MRLQTQLFLTLLIASALLIASLFAINTWSFSRGFTSYVNQSRLQPLLNALAIEYEENGWQWANAVKTGSGSGNRANKPPRQWVDLIATHVLSPSGEGRSLASARRDKGEKRNDRKRRDNKPPSRGPDPRLRRSLNGLVLADASRQRLIGNLPQRQLTWLPIINIDETVGYLGFRKNERFEGLMHRAFEKQQRKFFAWAALALVLMSGLLSFPLAARLVRPITQVNEAVGEIRDGSFATRLDDGRKDELGDLSRSINALAESLQANQSARQRWIAEISHELRTPLAVLQGELEAMQDGVRPLDPDSIASLHEQTGRLSRLINDLHTLSLSDLGALDYRFGLIDCAAHLSDFVDARRYEFDAAGLALQFDAQGPQPVRLDSTRFDQLLENLLSNSIRYTDQGGRVSIHLEPVGSSLRMTWADSKPGVSTDQLQQLFEPLFRADSSRSRESGGSGLGLAIVRRIVEAHSGTVTAGHAAQGGVEIVITLPLATENKSEV